ncbi:biliverdin-producing heme oxygenase [Henriciella sp. AS95]|uniref:biliverdin-producing heme oxygenase n=1 Tax=Henriciella sp. AS95 TaxID=3135782 RepID=UPI003181E55F
MASLLHAHAIALSWCYDAIPNSMMMYRRAICELIGAIAADLAQLDQPPVTHWPTCPDTPAPHPLGIVYVVAGSRLGGRMLVRQVEASPDKAVAAATDYFTCNTGDELWRNVLLELRNWHGNDRESDRIITGARETFEWFAIAQTETEKGRVAA